MSNKIKIKLPKKEYDINLGYDTNLCYETDSCDETNPYRNLHENTDDSTDEDLIFDDYQEYHDIIDVEVDNIIDNIPIKNREDNLAKKISELYEFMEENMKKINIRLERIENKLNKNISDKKPDNMIIPLCKENIELDEKYVLDCIWQNTINTYEGDIQLIIKYYFDNKVPPIKKINSQKYEYWDGNMWINDSAGYKIADILKSNIHSIYTKYNNIDTIDDIEQFMSNQKYISNMNNEVYKKGLIKKLFNVL